MSQWDKLLNKVLKLSNDVRFSELKKILESYGYEMRRPSSGGSHCIFRKEGKAPITIPVHTTIKHVYIELVKDIILNEVKTDENT